MASAMTTKAKKQEAEKLEQYESSHCAFELELAMIRDLVEELPGDREEVTWALVGSMRYVTLLLREARQHLQDMQEDRT